MFIIFDIVLTRRYNFVLKQFVFFFSSFWNYGEFEYLIQYFLSAGIDTGCNIWRSSSPRHCQDASVNWAACALYSSETSQPTGRTAGIFLRLFLEFLYGKLCWKYVDALGTCPFVWCFNRSKNHLLQLAIYKGPVKLIRRWRDEMIVTDLSGSDQDRRASNCANNLLKTLLRSRYPKLIDGVFFGFRIVFWIDFVWN